MLKKEMKKNFGNKYDAKKNKTPASQ